MATPLGKYLVKLETTVDRKTNEVVARWTEMNVTADEDGDGIASKRRVPKQALRFENWGNLSEWVAGHFTNITGF